jgi:hypothetical protein
MRRFHGTLPRTVLLLCGAAAAIGTPLAARGADARAHEVVLFRPATATFYIRRGAADAPATEIAFGAPGDLAFFADFSGDGKRAPALYRKGQWLISTHADGKADITIAFGGQGGDTPLVGDVDGDGRADLVAFRAGEWLVRGTRNPAVTQVLHFGAAGDVPLLADFNGDGKVDLALYRNGHWFVDFDRDGKADLEFAFGGAPGDRPFASDWNGSGRAAAIVFRDGNWLVSEQRDGRVSSEFGFGVKGDIPLAARALK